MAMSCHIGQGRFDQPCPMKKPPIMMIRLSGCQYERWHQFYPGEDGYEKERTECADTAEG